MTLNRYRKKPVEIEAIQWTGKNFPELEGFAGEHFQLVHPMDRVRTPASPLWCSMSCTPPGWE